MRLGHRVRERYAEWPQHAVLAERAHDRGQLQAHVQREQSPPGSDNGGSAAPGPDVVAVDNPKGGGKRLVRLETIHVAQANGDYARIVCDDGRFLLRTPLTQLERDWAGAGFARVHRAYLVNLSHAVELRTLANGTAVLVMRDETEIPVARRNVASLRRRLNA